MTNAMSIIILMPGKKDGEADNKYKITIKIFLKKQTIPVEVHYFGKLLRNPVNIFLYSGHIYKAVSGYLTYTDLIAGTNKAANEMREVKL